MSSKRPRRERRVPSIPSDLPRSRIERAGYVAEIIHDRRTGLHYCIIQPEGSADILWLGQCSTADDARHIALSRIREFIHAAGAHAAD